MRVELRINIAGHALPWSFEQMSRLGAWLNSVPWIYDGGIRVLKIVDLALVHEFAEAISFASRGRDSSGWLRIVEELDDDFGTLAEALTFLISGTSTNLDLRQLRDRIGAVLSESPYLFLISIRGSSAVQMLSDASALEDQIAKSSIRYPLAILFFCSTSEPAFIRDDFDLTIGFPSEPTLQTYGQSDSELWGRYLHARIAWETAGNAIEAATVLGPKVSGIVRSDDDSIECTLNEYAALRGAGVSEEEFEAFRLYLDDEFGLKRREVTEFKRTEMRLIRKGILWRRPGNGIPVTSPWYARHLLRIGTLADATPLLQHALMCAPLAREILAACFEIEAQERAHYWRIRQTLSANKEIIEECMKKLQEFREEKPSSAFAFYPSDCPAKPIAAWQFATFGQFFDGLTRDERTTLRQRIVGIRNAVAHGHYVSWRMLETFHRSRQELFERPGVRSARKQGSSVKRE